MTRFAITLLSLLLSASTYAADENKYGEQLFEAYLLKNPTPNISALDETVTLDEAYDIQRDYVDLRAKIDPIAGYKAGLTTPATQLKFNVETPLAGALFRSGQLATNSIISLQGFQQAKIETEIGFIFKQQINTPVSDLETLVQSVYAIVPVVEIPDLGFKHTSVKGVDLVANNVASQSFIIGEPINPTGLDLNDLDVVLRRNNTPIYSGKGLDVMGNQWTTLQWLVNRIIAQGWTITPNQVLITGAIGQMIDAQPGQYLAEFGPLGHIAFSVQSEALPTPPGLK